MKNIQNNELDDLFKNSAKDNGLKFNPRAWKLLEEKLDKYYSKKALIRKVIYSSLIIIFL